ncbi:MAG: hypothetical protein K2I52_01000, partial [Muribaculaceae bacterium]|nr:hypothetical protein [Muribaculaceae bacterium]
MNCLYIFNPENDLALADGSHHFTPPAAALRLAAAGAVLPVWYAGCGDFVLASVSDALWMESVGMKFGLDARIVSDVPGLVRAVEPWGWSRYLKYRLQNAGVPSECLPSDRVLDDIRCCSHRFTSVLLHRALAGVSLPYPLPDEPVMVSDPSVIADRLRRGEDLFVKSPLSGSGRGILDSRSAPERQILRLATGVIRRQGAVMVERCLDKVAYFAMLYDYYDGVAGFVGYSSFYNVGYSAYGGNILMPDDRLRLSVASNGGPAEWLDSTRDAVAGALESVLGDRYNGPLGVDMMVYDRGGLISIAPCVEVNVRMTMGRVAHALSSRYIAEGARGVM